MNTKKILGVVAVLALVAVAMVGAGAATDGSYKLTDNNGSVIGTYTTLTLAVDAMNADTTHVAPYKIEILTAYDGYESGTSGIGAGSHYIEIQKPVEITNSLATTPVVNVRGIIIGDYDTTTDLSGMSVTLENMNIHGGYNIIQVVENNTNLKLKNVTINTPYATGKIADADQIMCAITLNGEKWNTTASPAVQTRNSAAGSTITIEDCSLGSTHPTGEGSTSGIYDNGVIGIWASECNVIATDSTFTSTAIPIVTAADSNFSKNNTYIGSTISAGNNGNVSIDATNTVTPATTLNSHYTEKLYQFVNYTGLTGINTPATDANDVSTDSQSKGTVVKLNVASTFTFSVPSEVTLKGEETKYNAGVVEVKSSVKVPGKHAYVGIAQASYGSTKIESGSDLYIQIDESGKSDTVKYCLTKDASSQSVTGIEVGDVDGIIDLNLDASEDQPTAKESVYFYTLDMGSAKSAGNYTGTLTFKMEVVDAPVAS